MREDLGESINRVVTCAFGRMAGDIAKVEAKIVTNARKLVELRQEISQQMLEAAMLQSIDLTTAEFQAMRTQTNDGPTLCSQARAACPHQDLGEGGAPVLTAENGHRP